MANNALSIEQAYTFMSALYGQAVGNIGSIVGVDSKNFVSVGQAVLKTGYDNTMAAISQVLGRTVFSIRPYTARFKGIDVDNQRWGNMTRKINYADNAIDQTDDSITLTDGSSVDPWSIKKPTVLQTNWYGQQAFQDHVTIFETQLDTAFTGPEEFARFISGVLQNLMDKLEMFRENEARAALINFAAGKAAANNQYINVLQAYYDETGVELAPATMLSDSYYVAFTKWLYSYINTLTRMMAERSTIYHINVTGKAIPRHTPADRMKGYMSARIMDAINSIALPSVYGADRLKMIDWEGVAYWQNINDPMTIKAKPVYLATDGTLTEAGSDTTISNMVGILFDEEAILMNRFMQRMDQTPINPRGLYSNLFYHEHIRVANDFTENAVVLYAAAPTTT